MMDSKRIVHFLEKFLGKPRCVYIPLCMRGARVLLRACDCVRVCDCGRVCASVRASMYVCVLKLVIID